MTSYPKPRLIKNPTAQWEQRQEPINWAVVLRIIAGGAGLYGLFWIAALIAAAAGGH